jgi:hypothetical protein
VLKKLLASDIIEDGGGVGDVPLDTVEDSPFKASCYQTLDMLFAESVG